MREFLYEARDGGAAVKDTVVATDVGDARAQLARMGLQNVVLRTDKRLELVRPEPNMGNLPPLLIDAAYDPLPVAVLKVYLRSWPYAAPGPVLIAMALATGWIAPWWGMALLVGTWLYVACYLLPAALYGVTISARAYGRYDIGLRYARVLRVIALDKLISPFAQDAECAKMMAGTGELEDAVALLAPYESTTAPAVYLAELVAVYHIAGERELAIAGQRRALELTGSSRELRIDLAYTLVRFSDRHEEARRLIAGIDAGDLSELYGHVLRATQGMLAQARGQHETALKNLRSGHDGLARHTSPLICGMRAELRGYIALSLKALGKRKEAQVLWMEVLPLLKVHRCTRLMEAYDRVRSFRSAP